MKGMLNSVSFLLSDTRRRGRLRLSAEPAPSRSGRILILSRGGACSAGLFVLLPLARARRDGDGFGLLPLVGGGRVTAEARLKNLPPRRVARRPDLREDVSLCVLLEDEPGFVPCRGAATDGRGHHDGARATRRALNLPGR